MNAATDQTPLLSICIPTYNRLPKLRRLLTALLPQLTPACELVILDNFSDEDVASGIQDLLAGFQACPVRVIRNAANVGGNANILRCLEMGRGEWVWISGDDDVPTENAITTILEECQTNPNTLFINFRSTLLEVSGIKREKTVTAEGLEGFISMLDDFSNLLFISACLYRRASVIPYLRRAYAFIDTCGTQVAIVLISLLQDGGTTQLSHLPIVHWEPAEGGDHWQVQVIYRRLQRLLDLIPTVELRELWFKKMSLHAPAPLRTLPSLFKYVVAKKGNLEAVRDQLETSSYLASMIPSYRGRSLRLWLTAYAASFLWVPIYGIWSLIPASSKNSLLHYGHQTDFTHQFLNDNRV